MAILDQIELPNGTTYDISDASARKLDNNDFDTINVTELNAGDVIVTGAARFLNTINGDISGNAETATSATKATQDESGNNIKSTYANAISISDHTITLKNKNGTSLGTVTVPDNNTTYTVATGTANGKIKVTPSSGSAYEVSVYGLKSAAYKDVTDSYSATGTDPVSGKAVAAAIDGLPSPMVFRGSLGTGGTITALPVDGTAKVGDTYKVITAGTYASKAAKVGDTFICLTKTSSANTWELIPSGDEPSGTVTSVAISNGGGLSVSGSPITSSGTITISHADTSSQASVDNSGRTYIQDISLDTYGHVTKITSATETVVNTDRYVNSAAFADATSADANNPVKMTLTRAGSDTASVTAYLPKVSSSSAGVAPKGAAVSSQSQSTKFLREDGTWAAPSYTTNTNTTYSLSASGESVVLTGSDSSSKSVSLGTQLLPNLPTWTADPTDDVYLIRRDTAGGAAYGQVKFSTVWHYIKGKTDSAYVDVTGDTMTGKLIVPKTRIANTCYGVSFGRTTSTPVETILYTGIKWVSSTHMPVVHLTGYAYGLYAPIEFKIGFYIYNDHIGWCGVTNMGAWQPDVYLFKYTRDSVNYVAVGLAGSCYYLQLQADVQDEMGKFANIVMDDANWSWDFLTTAGTIPEPDDGITCIKVPYKATILALPLTGGTMTGTIVTPTNDNMGIEPATNNYGQVGSTSKHFYRAYINHYYGTTSHITNWDSNNNIGSPSTSSAASTRGYVNFYNTCAAGGTQTKTTLYANSNAAANINITMPTTSGTLALASTTLSGYGITDAKIASGTITLGSNTITPLTASSTLDATKLSGTIPSSCYTDTKNTAGSTDTSSKIFLIGATSQAANPQTYSDNEVYATSGVLTTKSVQVGGSAATMEYSATTKSINFVFAN